MKGDVARGRWYQTHDKTSKCRFADRHSPARPESFACLYTDVYIVYRFQEVCSAQGARLDGKYRLREFVAKIGVVMQTSSSGQNDPC